MPDFFFLAPIAEIADIRVADIRKINRRCQAIFLALIILKIISIPADMKNFFVSSHVWYINFLKRLRIRWQVEIMREK